MRVLGLGTTPQDVGTPGLKCFIPTRLQMEILARKKAEGEKAALEQRILDMEEEIREERMVRESHNIEDNSQHGSNSQRQEVKHFHQLLPCLPLITKILYDILMLHVEPKIRRTCQ